MGAKRNKTNWRLFSWKPPSHNFMLQDTQTPGGGVPLGILAGGVSPTSPNPDPISDQKMPFPIPVFRPGLKNPYQFSDLTWYVIKHSIYISAERKSMLQR